jgi:hypothetical protein
MAPKGAGFDTLVDGYRQVHAMAQTSWPTNTVRKCLALLKRAHLSVSCPVIHDRPYVYDFQPRVLGPCVGMSQAPPSSDTFWNGT